VQLVRNRPRRIPSSGNPLRPIFHRMRHFRLWLFLVGVLSLVAEAVAAAVVWRGTVRHPRGF
jgi:hypothetical protein